MPDPYATLEPNLDALARVWQAGQMAEADAALIRFAFDCDQFRGNSDEDLAVLLAVTETLARRYLRSEPTTNERN
jgi:hypothetical protein